VVDWNGDDYADLVWNHLDTFNKTYVGLGNGDGTFGTPAVRIHAAQGWGAYQLAVGDVMGSTGSGDGRDDLAWVRWGSAATPLGVYTGRSDASQLLVYEPFQGIGGAYANYRLVPANVDGDADMDLVMNYTSSPNRAYVVTSDGDGTWTVDPGYTDNPNAANWASYGVHAADVDASGKDALIWTDGQSVLSAVSVGRWNGSDFTYTYQTHNFDRGTLTTEPLEVGIADVEGDGWSDIVWNLRSGAVNKVFVSLGLGDGTFSFSTAEVSHPDTSIDWALYQMFTGDVNGDGRDDIVWIHPAATNRIYTAIGKH